VIPNFLDCERYRRRPDAALERRLAPAGEAVVMHVSNFRPVKRVHAVLDVFMRIARAVPARLVLVGDGPDRASLEQRVTEERLDSVVFAGEQQDLVSWLSSADLFLLPSSQESFGMAALEAMACQVPVVASRVGGLPEVIADDETGFLREPDDLDGMAECGIAVLGDRAWHERIGAAAALSVRTRFCAEVIVPMYEACYREVLDASRAPA
jgi:L-malate glycosyltransferase